MAAVEVEEMKAVEQEVSLPAADEAVVPADTIQKNLARPMQSESHPSSNPARSSPVLVFASNLLRQVAMNKIPLRLPMAHFCVPDSSNGRAKCYRRNTETVRSLFPTQFAHFLLPIAEPYNLVPGGPNRSFETRKKWFAIPTNRLIVARNR